MHDAATSGRINAAAERLDAEAAEVLECQKAELGSES